MGETQIWVQTINGTRTRHITPTTKGRKNPHTKIVGKYYIMKFQFTPKLWYPWDQFLIHNLIAMKQTPNPLNNCRINVQPIQMLLHNTNKVTWFYAFTVTDLTYQNRRPTPKMEDIYFRVSIL